MNTWIIIYIIIRLLIVVSAIGAVITRRKIRHRLRMSPRTNSTWTQELLDAEILYSRSIRIFIWVLIAESVNNFILWKAGLF